MSHLAAPLPDALRHGDGLVIVGAGADDDVADKTHQGPDVIVSGEVQIEQLQKRPAISMVNGYMENWEQKYHIDDMFLFKMMFLFSTFDQRGPRFVQKKIQGPTSMAVSDLKYNWTNIICYIYCSNN